MASTPAPLEEPSAHVARPVSGESAAAATRDLAPGSETVNLPPGAESPNPPSSPDVLVVPPPAAAETAQPGPARRLGPYELVRLIGRGGMGAVWEALDTRLNRRVALKVMVAGAHASEHDTERFRREAQNSAKLRQPHIVPVHDFGVEAGHHYLVMDLVDGVMLADALRQRQFTYREKAALLEKVVRAVHYAHEQGVIHRDLKPSNIMLEYKTTSGSSRRVAPETPPLADPQSADAETPSPEPLVMDFGLAKDLAKDSSLSQSGHVVGTPAYMPPEQAEGRSKDVGPRSDVYSLGAILYEMLTGRAPFTGENVVQILRATTSEDPVPPRQITPGVPRDLETICLKCLEKKPERRYASAAALADDLRAWLAGDSISARPPTLAERAVKRVRRNPSVYAVSTVALAVIVLGTVAFMLSLDQKRREAEKARDDSRAAEERAQKEKDNALASQKAEARQREYAENARRRAELEVYRSGIVEADRLASEGKPSDALAVLTALDPRFRGWEYGQLLCRAKRNTYAPLWRGPADGNCSLAFSPDAARLLAGATNGMKVWEAPTGRELLSREAHGSGVSSVAVSPDGRWLARGGRDGSVTVWLADTGAEHLTLPGHTDAVTFMAFSPQGTHLATGSSDKTVRVWVVQTGQELPQTKLHEAGVTSIAFSPNGTLLAAGSANRTIRLWEAETGRELFSLKGHAGPVSAVAFSPDGKLLASAARDRTIRLWDAAAGRQLSAFEGQPSDVLALAFGSDGRRLVSGCLDGVVRVWDVEARRETVTLREHKSPVSAVTFSANGTLLASRSADGTVIVWRAEIGRGYRTLSPPGDPATSVAFSPNNRWLAAGFSKGSVVKLWDIDTGQELRSLRGHKGHVASVAFSPDSRQLASGSFDNTVKIWDTETGRELQTLAGHAYWVASVVFDAAVPKAGAGSLLVSGSWDATVRIWDAQTGKELRVLKGHDRPVNAVAISPDGTRVASASLDNSVKIWETETGKDLLTFKGHDREVRAVAFSPDGKWLTSTGYDDTVRLWDAQTGKERFALKDISLHWGYAVTFTPDGLRLVSGHHDGTVRIWSLETGQQLLVLKENPSSVFGVAVSPNGRFLAAACGDGTVRIWETDFGQ